MISRRSEELDLFSDEVLSSWKVSRNTKANCLQHDENGLYKLPSSGLRLSDFEIDGELGGSKFTLYRATHVLSGKSVVLKVINKGRMRSEPPHALRRIQTEIELHSRLSSPDIIPFLGMFHDDSNIYMVLEAAPDGDLEAAMLRQPGRRIDERRAALITAAVARALRYCHAQGIAHRDVKPGNLLLGPGERVRLADFGLSKEFASRKGVGARGGATLRRMNSTVGTPDYIAPETLFPRRTGYDHRCDMWSLGAMLYEMLVGRAPFYVEDMDETYDRISRADFSFPTGDDAISADAQQLISGLLHIDPKRRHNPSQVLTSRWIVGHCGPSVRGPSAAASSVDRRQLRVQPSMKYGRY